MKRMKSQERPNDMMLQVSMRVIAVIIFSFSVYLLIAGHNNPGGGFIGGLMTSCAVLVLFLVFGMKRMAKVARLHFTTLIGIGLLVAVSTGVLSMLYGYPFLTHVLSALPFDIGVYLVVVGAALTIILTIAEDDA